MEEIKIKCENCNRIFSVIKTKDIKPETKSLTCNWCPQCEDDATDYYKETHHENEIFGEQDPNQLKLI